METYRNEFDKIEDPMMWELHEIRNKLHQEIENRTIEEINTEGTSILDSIRKKYNAEKEVVV